MRNFINLIEDASVDWDNEMRNLENEARILAKDRPNFPRPADIDLFNRAREVIRHSEGLGGQCHEVSYWISHFYGWETVSGTYLAPNGEPACTNHFWNELPDGSILDSTADQLGEDDRAIRVIKPSDPLWNRYTCEWHEDWHPNHDDYAANWKQEKRDPKTYSGKIDHDRENEIRDQHGGDRYWYVGDDRQHVDAYLVKERKYEGDAEQDI